jgi:hypothetical protein
VRDLRRIQAVFLLAEPVHVGRSSDPEGPGLAGEEAERIALEFHPERARLDVDRIRDTAEVGPALTIPAVAGLGKVLRILRAARIAAPRDPLSLVGRPDEILALLERARGTRVRLSIRRRARLSFVAWTEGGVETVPDVVDVLESEEHYVVMRRGARVPLRIPRARVSRRQTRSERWYEVVGIERP